MALLGLLVFRQLLEGCVLVSVSHLLRTFRADPWLLPCVHLPLLKMIGIMALASAYLVAAILAIENMICLTFEAIGHALKGRPSFVYHCF